MQYKTWLGKILSVQGIIWTIILGLLVNWGSDLGNPVVGYFYPPCDSKKIELRADTLRKQALNYVKDQATMDQMMERSFRLYQQSYNKCKSPEAAMQIAIAKCKGLGTKQNKKTGRAFIHKAEMLGINRERIKIAINNHCS